MSDLTQFSNAALEQKIQALAKNPVRFFGKAIRAGETTIIPASRVQIRGDRVTARPVGAILITPTGVELRKFNPPAARVLSLAMIAATIFWTSMLLHPAWKPDTNLLKQVRELVQALREKPAGD